MPLGIVAVSTPAESATPPTPASFKIVIDGVVVMEDLSDLPNALCIMFGLIYALHLNYPKCMRYTFLFIQQILLMLKADELKPKLQSLKNDLEM